jgi:integrase
LGYDGSGKRRRRAVYGQSKREVQEKLRKLQASADDCALANRQRLRLSQFLSQWLENVIRGSRRRNTYRSYEGVIRNHISKHLGGVLLEKLTPVQVQGMYQSMAEASVSPRTQQLAHAVLRASLKRALKWGLISRNVCDAVDPPRVSKKKMQAYDVGQIKALLAALDNHRLKPLFVLAIATGLREGELFGLHWSDIDLEDHTLSVQQQLEEIDGKFRLTEPKSASGKRRIELPGFAVDALHEHRKRMLAEGRNVKDGPVFCDRRGGWLRKSNFIRQIFKPAIRRANESIIAEAEKRHVDPALLPELRFHDLRHTAATLRLRQGDHPKVVQELLGHSQISLTLDTYSHVVPSMQKDSASKLDRLFRKQA